MRKNKAVSQEKEFSILTLDDDKIMTLTLQSYFQALGFHVDVENDPYAAIERIRTNHYDILLLDFLMRPVNGDEVVRRVREFDKDIFILLLTGHKSMAPPLKTIRELDIQGYYEKSDRFDQLELLVESCSKSIRQMRTIRSYRDGLKAVLEKIPALGSCKSMEVLLARILEQQKELLGWEDGLIYLDIASMGAEKLLAGSADGHFQGMGLYEGREELGREGFGEMSQNAEDHMVRHGDVRMAALCAEGGTAFGILMMKSARPEPEEKDQLFAVYARQAGAVIGNMIYQSLLQLQNQELNRTYIETVDLMRKMVDAKDFYTRGHSDRVSYYAVLIGKAMGKDAAYVERLRVGGLFHDIGKVGVPDAILQKPGKLTDEEYVRIKRHTTLGREMLTSVSSLRDILPIVESHHEWFDGSGYPAGMAGTEIAQEARIVSAADAFDAMTSKRTYRTNLTLEEAVEELKRGKGTQFDPEIVDVFIRVIETTEDILGPLKDTFSDLRIQEVCV